MKMLSTFRWNFPMGATGAVGAGAWRGAGACPGGVSLITGSDQKRYINHLPCRLLFFSIIYYIYNTLPQSSRRAKNDIYAG